ncbi:hypothetical protein ACFW9D_18965 [Streptomyces sp. NPDC059524]|uniref:hypothetical protein n=1 Tax=Streptomyces sp. NPDC059524 TaxID=3346856 RepID=UPI0036C6FB46
MNPQESPARRRLRERRERAALAAVETGLGDLWTGRGLTPDAEPAWTRAAIERAWSIHTEPDALLPDDCPPGVLDSWIEARLAEHGVGGVVHVASHVRPRPWLECRLPAMGWAQRVRGAVEEPWMFLSRSPGRLVIVTEAEYFFECRAASA